MSDKFVLHLDERIKAVQEEIKVSKVELTTLIGLRDQLMASHGDSVQHNVVETDAVKSNLVEATDVELISSEPSSSRCSTEHAGVPIVADSNQKVTLLYRFILYNIRRLEPYSARPNDFFFKGYKVLYDFSGAQLGYVRAIADRILDKLCTLGILRRNDNGLYEVARKLNIFPAKYRSYSTLELIDWGVKLFEGRTVGSTVIASDIVTHMKQLRSDADYKDICCAAQYFLRVCISQGYLARVRTGVYGITNSFDFEAIPRIDLSCGCSE